MAPRPADSGGSFTPAWTPAPTRSSPSHYRSWCRRLCFEPHAGAGTPDFRPYCLRSDGDGVGATHPPIRATTPPAPATDCGRGTSKPSARRDKVVCIRNWKLKAKQAKDGTDQAFRLAQREPKYSFECQRGQNGQRRIPGVATSAGAALGAPASNSCVSEPHRHVAALVQARFIGRPVRQLTLLLRDMMAALGIGLLWHDGNPDRE